MRLTPILGEIASKVAMKMRELGRSRQVLCITHLPQVAATASSHYVVNKEISQKRARTKLSEATGKAREEKSRECLRHLGVRDGACTRTLGRAIVDRSFLWRLPLEDEELD